MRGRRQVMPHILTDRRSLIDGRCRHYDVDGPAPLLSSPKMMLCFGGGELFRWSCGGQLSSLVFFSLSIDLALAVETKIDCIGRVDVNES